MRATWQLPASIAVLVWFGACGQPADYRLPVETAGAGEWHISSEPALVIGAVEGEPEYLLSGTLHAVRLRIDRFGLQGRYFPQDNARAGMYALPDGSTLVGHHCNVMDCVRPEDGAFRLPVGFVRITHGRTPADSIATTLGSEQVDLDVIRRNPDVLGLRPFMRREKIAFGGDPLVIYVGESGSTTITTYRVSDGARTTFDADLTASKVTQADVDDWISNLTTPRRSRETLERSLLVIGVPEALPLYEHLTVDSDGNLWIEHRLCITEHRTRWSVYNRTGTHLSDVEVPARVEALDIGRDYVIAEWTDENDVPFVYVYPLSRFDSIR